MLDLLLSRMSPYNVSRWISYLATLGSACMLGRLIWLGLARRYAWLAGYLLADVLQAALVVGAAPYSLWYGNIYFAGQAAKSILAVGLAMQLWLLALHGYPGVARFGRRAAFYMLLITLALAASGLLLQAGRSASQSQISYVFYAIDGALDSMVGLFLAGATAFLLWFPVEVGRNIALIMGGFVFKLAKDWAALLLVNLHPKSAYSVDSGMLIIEVLILIFWIATVRIQGEAATTVTGHRWNPSETEYFMSQLDAINRRLEQAFRR